MVINKNHPNIQCMIDLHLKQEKITIDLNFKRIRITGY